MNTEFCDKCFLDVIFKRIRKTIRKNNYFSKGDNVIINDPLTRKIIKEVTYIPLKIIYNPNAKLNTKHKIILPLTIDYFIVDFLESIFKGRKSGIKIPENILLIYKDITSEEIERLARLKRARINMGKTETNRFLDQMEQRYGGIKFNLNKIQKLYKLILPKNTLCHIG